MNNGKRLVIVQEIKTTNDGNGNPRALIYITVPDADNMMLIEKGHRSALQVAEEQFSMDMYIIMRLMTVSVPINEYKRLKKSDGYYDNI